MSNQRTDSPFSTSAFFEASPITSITPGNSSSTALDEIATNDIISKAVYVYGFFAVLGFLPGCFLLYNFIQLYRAHKRLAWLDVLLWAFCGFQMLLLLLSLYALAHRPRYMQSTALGCAALSFTINAASLCGLLVLVLMAYVLSLDPPCDALLRKPKVCAALVSLTSLLMSLLLAGLRGPRDDLQENGDCFVDPVHDGVSYAASKLCIMFLIPYIVQLGLIISGCVRQWKSRGRFLSGSKDGPVFLTVSAQMFFCLLFYCVVLVRAAQLERKGMLTYHERAFLSVAEFVLFSGSSVSLLLVLFVHRPCREGLHGAWRQLRDCCQRRGTQPHRNIIAPHIEITDTLQDIES
ncbi:uncharacterized protein LOC114481525 [Gouania willdenowi]|uniref:Uncharacterized LOC114481525 n=1 Tax=Gouania willdenowi TaxID=441366 RepID=A0A8C5EGC8_GOUWI|nr:uncharacterized protein LOC114481525 [Gouania willdenowi]